MSKDIKISELKNFEEQTKRHDGYKSYVTTSNYSFTNVDKIKLLIVTTSTNTVTATLPPIADSLDRVIGVLKEDAVASGGIARVDGYGSETINGAYVGGSATSCDITEEGGIIWFKADENQWNIIGGACPDKWHEVGTTGEPSFSNSWVNFGSGFNNAAFRKTMDGDVQIRGLIKSGTVGNAAFTLPSGYLPLATDRFILMSNSVTGQGTIDTNGDVRPLLPSNNAWVSLSQIVINIL